MASPLLIFKVKEGDFDVYISPCCFAQRMLESVALIFKWYIPSTKVFHSEKSTLFSTPPQSNVPQ